MKLKRSVFLCLVVVLAFGVSVSAYDAMCVGEGNTIVIDGDLSDWNLADLEPIKHGLKEQVVRGSWDGVEDSSGNVYLRWTKDYLLLAADVTDNVLGLATGRIDSGDSVGLTIDIFSGTRSDLPNMLIEMTPFPPNDDWSKAVLFRIAPGWSSLGESNVIVRAQRKADGSGYYLEAAIPFATLTQGGKTVNPVEDGSVWFNTILTDSDDGASRKSVLVSTGSPENSVGSWFGGANEFDTLNFVGQGAGTVSY